MTYLFTKQGCDKCDWVKDKVNLSEREDVQVLSLDEDNSDALAMLAYYECVTLAEKKLPILISESDEVITGAIHVKNHLKKN